MSQLPRGQYLTFPPQPDPHAGAVPDRLVEAGRRAFPGFNIRVVARTPSTQDWVRRAAREGAAEGTCCVAQEQSEGRGRQARTWTASPGTALLVSLLLHGSPRRLAGLSLAAGLAVADMARDMGAEVRLKWPNDVLSSDGKKLAGILAEVEPRSEVPAIVLGIGINLTVDDFPTAIAGASLHRLIGRPADWSEALTTLLPRLRQRLDVVDASGIPGLRDDWSAMAVGLGEPVRATIGTHEITGVALGIDDDGALLINSDGNITRLIAGDVHVGSHVASRPPSQGVPPSTDGD